jgi:hypothetical protein
VVRHVEPEVLEIQAVARQAEADDLAQPGVARLLAIGEAGDQRGADLRAIPFADQIAVRLKLAQLAGQRTQRAPVLVGQRRVQLQLAGQQIERMRGDGASPRVARRPRIGRYREP